MRELLLLALKHKAIIVVVSATLSVGAAAAFASQDGVFPGPTGGGDEVVTAEDVTPTPDANDPTVDPTEDPTTTPDPNVTETPDPNASVTPDPNATEAPREIKGIPDSNPVKQPEDGDGVCEKGETVVKTTPSGVQVAVPCNAVMKTNGAKAPTVTPDPNDGTTAGSGNEKTNNGNANGKNKGGG